MCFWMTTGHDQNNGHSQSSACFLCMDAPVMYQIKSCAVIIKLQNACQLTGKDGHDQVTLKYLCHHHVCNETLSSSVFLKHGNFKACGLVPGDFWELKSTNLTVVKFEKYWFYQGHFEQLFFVLYNSVAFSVVTQGKNLESWDIICHKLRYHCRPSRPYT